MKVCLCVRVGGITRGSGYAADLVFLGDVKGAIMYVLVWVEEDSFKSLC